MFANITQIHITIYVSIYVYVIFCTVVVCSSPSKINLKTKKVPNHELLSGMVAGRSCTACH